jgi:hypothetical protein
MEFAFKYDLGIAVCFRKSSCNSGLQAFVHGSSVADHFLIVTLCGEHSGDEDSAES